ncbi:MAG: TonB-dependent receptor, partial [Novosphingobium sp.]|nr:TonB-dependent receptor [Novosphingobium sp.]
MTTISLRAVLLGGVAAMSGIVAVPAFAQGSDAIEQQRSGVTDIVVTARRREENLQDTPVSVTAVNSAIIEERGIENFVDISKITPNVKIHDTPGGIGA